VDARSDLWALGVILYQLVAGWTPFHGDTLQGVFARVLFGPPTPLGEYRHDMPPGFEAIILRCLERDRERRFRDVAEFAAALAPYAPARARVYSQRVARVMSGSKGRAAMQSAPELPAMPLTAHAPAALVVPLTAPAPEPRVVPPAAPTVSASSVVGAAAPAVPVPSPAVAAAALLCRGYPGSRHHDVRSDGSIRRASRAEPTSRTSIRTGSLRRNTGSSAACTGRSPSSHPCRRPSDGQPIPAGGHIASAGEYARNAFCDRHSGSHGGIGSSCSELWAAIPRKNVCNGMGASESVDDDADPVDDMMQCTDNTCSGGIPMTAPTASATPCTEDNGSFCNGTGACVEVHLQWRLHERNLQ
jgi:hypothetical protein